MVNGKQEQEEKEMSGGNPRLKDIATRNARIKEDRECSLETTGGVS
jgi:hypothetical protein